MEQQASTPLSSLDKTILVVDDDPTTRLICIKTLRAAGFTVLEAEGSSESLKILETHQAPIDLLLTDLMLTPPELQFTSGNNLYPRVHGHEVIQRARATKKINRVILMSSLSDEDRKAYQLSLDHVPFLQKPFSVEAMVEVVRTVLAAEPLPNLESDSNTMGKQDVRWYG